MTFFRVKRPGKLRGEHGIFHGDDSDLEIGKALLLERLQLRAISPDNIGQAASARLFPRSLEVKELNLEAGFGQLKSQPGSGRAGADDADFFQTHPRLSLSSGEKSCHRLWLAR